MPPNTGVTGTLNRSSHPFVDVLSTVASIPVTIHPPPSVPNRQLPSSVPTPFTKNYPPAAVNTTGNPLTVSTAPPNPFTIVLVPVKFLGSGSTSNTTIYTRSITTKSSSAPALTSTEATTRLVTFPVVAHIQPQLPVSTVGSHNATVFASRTPATTSVPSVTRLTLWTSPTVMEVSPETLSKNATLHIPSTLSSEIIFATPPVPLTTPLPSEESCNDSFCRNEGTCVAQNGLIRCNCPLPFYGDSCEDGESQYAATSLSEC